MPYPPVPELAVVVRGLVDQPSTAFCMTKPADWRDLERAVAKHFNVSVIVLAVFKAFKQTGSSRDGSRVPIDAESWAAVEPDATVVFEPPPPPYDRTDHAYHRSLRVKLERDLPIKVSSTYFSF
jgi:hypothetical protein